MNMLTHKTIRNILLMLSFVLCGCEKDSGQNVFSIVTLNVTCPSVSAGIERVEVDNSLDGSFIRDLNTRQEYDIPTFQVGTATVKLRKGIYMISFDGKAVFSDGQVIQQGTHQALLAQESGKYAELWHAQAQYYTKQTPDADGAEN